MRGLEFLEQCLLVYKKFSLIVNVEQTKLKTAKGWEKDWVKFSKLHTNGDFRLVF